MSNEKFKIVLANNQVDDNLERYLNHMESLSRWQFHLNEQNFRILQEFRKICASLEKLDSAILNSAQKRALEVYHEHVDIKSISPSTPNEDGGTALKYVNPNGFISVTAILLSTITAGLAIAAILISRL